MAEFFPVGKARFVFPPGWHPKHKVNKRILLWLSIRFRRTIALSEITFLFSLFFKFTNRIIFVILLNAR